MPLSDINLLEPDDEFWRRCESCGEKVYYDHRFVGKKVRCACGGTIRMSAPMACIPRRPAENLDHATRTDEGKTPRVGLLDSAFSEQPDEPWVANPIPLYNEAPAASPARNPDKPDPALVTIYQPPPVTARPRRPQNGGEDSNRLNVSHAMGIARTVLWVGLAVAIVLTVWGAHRLGSSANTNQPSVAGLYVNPDQVSERILLEDDGAFSYTDQTGVLERANSSSSGLRLGLNASAVTVEGLESGSFRVEGDAIVIHCRKTDSRFDRARLTLSGDTLHVPGIGALQRRPDLLDQLEKDRQKVLAGQEPAPETQPTPTLLAEQNHIWTDAPIRAIHEPIYCLERTIKVPGATGMALSPDGKTAAIVVTGMRTQIRLMDLATRTFVRTFDSSHEGPGISFDPSGRTLYVGSEQLSTLGVYDASSGEQARAIDVGSVDREHLRTSSLFSISPDGQRIVATPCKSRNAISVYDRKLEKTRRLCSFQGHVTELCYSQDGTALLAVEHHPMLLDSLSGQARAAFDFLDGTYSAYAFSPDSTRLAAFDSGRAAVWDCSTGEGIRTSLPTYESLVRRVNVGMPIAWRPDGRLAAFAQGSDICLWSFDDPEDSELLLLHAHDGPVSTMAFSPGGETLLSLSDSGMLKIWQLPAAAFVSRLASAPTAGQALNQFVSVTRRLRANRHSLDDVEQQLAELDGSDSEKSDAKLNGIAPDVRREQLRSQQDALARDHVPLRVAFRQAQAALAQFVKPTLRSWPILTVTDIDLSLQPMKRGQRNNGTSVEENRLAGGSFVLLGSCAWRDKAARLDELGDSLALAIYVRANEAAVSTQPAPSGSEGVIVPSESDVLGFCVDVGEFRFATTWGKCDLKKISRLIDTARLKAIQVAN